MNESTTVYSIDLKCGKKGRKPMLKDANKLAEKYNIGNAISLYDRISFISCDAEKVNKFSKDILESKLNEWDKLESVCISSTKVYKGLKLEKWKLGN